MTESIYTHFRTGKYLMTMLEWKHLKCTNCNVDLIIDKSTEFEEVKLCPKCGKKHLLLKKLRKEE